MIRELIILTPSIKDDAVKNINRLLAKEKIMQHIEQYLIDFTPGVAFEHFLVQNVFTTAPSSHPYTLNLMRPDFKSYLNEYIESLYAIFEFYILEYPFPQPILYRFSCISPDVSAYQLINL